VASLLRDLELYQTVVFVFQPIREIQHFLQNVQGVDENERYDMAQKLTEQRQNRAMSTSAGASAGGGGGVTGVFSLPKLFNA